MENKISAEIINHSKGENGGELITYKLTYPRIILSEVNTHKMIMKNTSSCLDEDTLISVFYKDKQKHDIEQIKRLFEIQEKGLELPEIISFNMRDKEYRTGEKYEESFIKQKISKVFKSGVKKVYRIHFRKDFHLDCTDEHRLLAYDTEKGFKWITLKDFQLEEKEGQVFGNLSVVTETLYGISLTDFETNNSHFPNKKDEKLKTCFLGFTPFILERGDGKIRNPYVYRHIEAITYLGERETYDIEVDGKYHNFLANGIVVHNSRAIPFDKIMKVIEEDPFYPIAYQKHHKGMQGKEYFTDESDIANCEYMWSCAIESALAVAEDMYKNGLTKQLINRIVEPYTWVTQLCTGTRESFENLFRLRCPIYPGGCKSWKELCDLDSNYTMEASTLEKLKVNKGQAEIHFMDLAEKMYDALNESEPIELKSGEWHIPFSNEPCFTPEMSLMDKIILSCAMIARTSYTKIGDSQNISLETARNIFERCKKERHDSIFEHAGRCMTKYEYETNFRGVVHLDVPDDEEYYYYGGIENARGWNKGFKGFLQLRTFIEEGRTIK